jgi:MoaA/NifB/PqqE/SkfB family radical SAM enzyme
MHSALRHARALFLKKSPVHLTYFVTRRCNARCPFCFYEEARDASAGPPELSLEEIRRVAESLDGLLWVLFSGGEPFLRKDLAEISQVFHDTNRPAFLTYPSNGLLPETIAETTEEILERCGKSVVVLKLSLDGLGGDHDALRRIPGGFEQVLRTCRRMAALADRHPNLELGINTLFCSENQERMGEIIDFVRGLDGVRSHTITMVRGPLRDGRFQDVDLDQYQRAIHHLETRWSSGRERSHRFRGGPLKAALDRLQRQLIHQTLTQGRRVIPCQAGRLSLVLTESGELHPCEGRWDDSLGNVRDAGYDVARLLRSEPAGRVRGQIAAGGCCCSHECNFLTNILSNPRMHPRLLGEYARLRLGRPGMADAPVGSRQGSPMMT